MVQSETYADVLQIMRRIRQERMIMCTFFVGSG
jgi:hypothetical protein